MLRKISLSLSKQSNLLFIKYILHLRKKTITKTYTHKKAHTLLSMVTGDHIVQMHCLPQQRGNYLPEKREREREREDGM